MGTIKNNEVVIGTYDGVDFHYAFNQNKAFMINASEIASYLKIDLSEYLKKDSTKMYINSLLKHNINFYNKRGNGYERIEGKEQTLEDILLIENQTYYFDYFLIYDMTKDYLEFYFWIDDIRIDTIRKLLKQ
jgi:hypothetical protein